MKTVKITCKGADEIPLDDLLHFQGNLKDLSEENYQRCKASILAFGVSFPVNAWKERTKKWVIDGHQRVLTLRRMRDKEEYKIPKIPVAWVEAKDRQEAAKKVLAATSQYGELTGDGLHGFIKEFKLDMSFVKETFNFSEIDFGRFESAYFPQNPKTKTVSFEAKEKEEAAEAAIESGHKCPRCGWKFLNE